MKTKEKQQNNKVDILAFGAHPDDVEAGCSGLLIKLANEGYKTAIIDMSEAELSTNGTVALRYKEAENARKIMRVSYRENLKVPNNFFANSVKLQNKLVEKLRFYRPEMVLLPYFKDRHPDHEATPKLVKDALFTAGLSRFKTKLPPHRPKYVFYYPLWYEFKPSFIVDISGLWEKKKEAILAYKSQFILTDKTKKTIDNSDDTMKYWEARARHYGFMANVSNGEAYLSHYRLGIDDPFKIMPNFF